MDESTLEIIEGARGELDYERQEAIEKLRAKVRSLYPGDPLKDGQFSDTFNKFGDYLDEESVVVCSNEIVGIVRIPDLAPIRVYLKKSDSETTEFSVHYHFLGKYGRDTLVVSEWIYQRSFSEAIIRAAKYANSEEQARNELKAYNRPWYIVFLDWLRKKKDK